MPVVALKTSKTNLTRQAKAQIVEEFSETPMRVAGEKPETIHIVIDAVDHENWGHAGKIVADTRKIARD